MNDFLRDTRQSIDDMIADRTGTIGIYETSS